MQKNEIHIFTQLTTNTYRTISKDIQNTTITYLINEKNPSKENCLFTEPRTLYTINDPDQTRNQPKTNETNHKL